MHKLIDKCPAGYCDSDFEVERFVTSLITEVGTGEDTYTSSWTAECANGHRIDVRGKITIDGRTHFMVDVPEVIRTATRNIGPCIACQSPIKLGQKYFMQAQKHVHC